MILPSDFTIEKYGLVARFVEENDAAFILKLRTDENLNKYLNHTDNNVETQKQWIREYKKRERKGEDYYFIFFKDGEPIGLNRMYSMHDTTFTTGSWLFLPSAPFGCSFLASIMVREVAYETLGMSLEDGYDGCHVDNKQVMKFNMLMGCKITGRRETGAGVFITGQFDYEGFKKGRKKILKLLGVSE